MSRERLEAYADVIAGAFPPGAAWQGFRDYDGVGHSFLIGKVATWLDVDLTAERLVLESQPARAVQMLADHEKQVGLPDCCFQTAGLPIEDRRAAVLTRLRATGGQRPRYFVNLAESLGYQIEVVEYRPFMVGISQVGGANSSNNSRSTRYDMLGATADMRAWWRVRVLGPRVTWFKVGVSTLGQDPLAWISRAEDLECLLGRYQPAHSLLTMSYEGE
ncbi:MAG: putative phage tail protein [Thalassospira sp.]|uniref:putative phage tail protein n=1 Tax=Thalassospira sp. TaxID=1912094 RepID=UPI003A849BD5